LTKLQGFHPESRRDLKQMDNSKTLLYLLNLKDILTYLGLFEIINNDNEILKKQPTTGVPLSDLKILG
jgi:hypothetical protein